MNHPAPPAPSSALREVRGLLARPRTLAALAGVVVLLVVAGPFGTDAWSPWQRAIYWAPVAALTYAAGTLTGTLVGPRLARAGLPGPAARAGSYAAVGAVVAALVVVLTLPYDPIPLPELPRFAGTVALTGVVIAALLDMPGGAGDAPAETAPAILARVPLARRGALLALSAEDHYVRVRTRAGEALVLMRLADAIAEAAPVPGLRVHRSHWVATGAVADARRTGDRAILTLADGAEIPASRAKLPALREAGVL